LIEVIVVLFFMVVAAAIVIPRFGTFQRGSQAKDAARNIASYVREARDLAIERQRTITLEPGPNGNSLVARFDDSSSIVETAAGQSMDQDQNVSGEMAMPPVFFPETLKADVEPVSQSNDSDLSSGLSFTPDGHAPDVNVIILYAPDQGYRISVRRQATRVRIEDVNSPDTFPAPTTLNTNSGGTL
jgi:type II secretory pathway pseudopilin PulG